MTQINSNNERFISINYHLTKNCNMNCKGCFARYEKLTNGTQHVRVLANIIRYANENNITNRKINFVGGEPTLIKSLPELVEIMHNAGFTTSIVTNGSLITQEYLDQFKIKPDWIGISIDSFDSKTNWNLGRITNKGVLDYIKIASLIKKNNIKLKVNTMVNRLNYTQNMSKLIAEIKPNRWKLFQFLEIKGQNDKFSNLLSINNEEFTYFIETHNELKSKVDIIPEDNNSMKGSYLMISPEGTLFDNVNGYLKYSSSLLDVEFEDALKEIEFSKEKMVLRDGVYNWG